MTMEEKILRNDEHNNYTESDIRKHLKNGVIYYASYEDYYNDCISGGCDPEDIHEMWKHLDESTVDGVVYRYECIL